MAQIRHRTRSSDRSSSEITRAGRSNEVGELRRAGALMKEIDDLLDRHVAAMDRMIADIDAIRAGR